MKTRLGTTLGLVAVAVASWTLVPLARSQAASTYRSAGVGFLDFGGCPTTPCDPSTSTITYATGGVGFWVTAGGPGLPGLLWNRIRVDQKPNGSVLLTDERAVVARVSSRADLRQCTPRCRFGNFIDILAGGGTDDIRVVSFAPTTRVRVDCGPDFDYLRINLAKSRYEATGCEVINGVRQH